MSTSDFDIGHVVCWISEVSIVLSFNFFFLGLDGRKELSLCGHDRRRRDA
jgi:hypothetical protein